jgi:hypothetical protein
MIIPQQSADQVTSDNSNGAHEMTQESRAQRRARERAHKHSTTSHDMQQQVAHRRAIRKNIPNGERHAQQHRSNAKFSSKKTTPRANLSDASTSSEPSPASNTLTSPAASALASTPAYTISTEGNSSIFIIGPCPSALLLRLTDSLML